MGWIILAIVIVIIALVLWAVGPTTRWSRCAIA